MSTEACGMTRREFLVLSALASAGAGLGNFGTTPASDRVRVAVVGLGRHGLRHIAEYQRLPNVDVVALCDTKSAALREAANALPNTGKPGPSTLSAWRRLLDRSDIDALSIAVPPQLRIPIAAAACSAGKDVLVEGPGGDHRTIGRLADVASANGRVVQQASSAYFAGVVDSCNARPGSFRDLHSAHIRRVVTRPGNHGSIVAAAVDDIGYARGILDVAVPSRVFSLAARSARSSSLLRAAIRFEFGEPGQEKACLLEVDALTPAWSESVTGGDRSTTRFRDRGGSFTVQCCYSPEVPHEGSLDSWSNFIRCVQTRNLNELIAPIAEARVSSLAIRIAEVSLEVNRPLTIDVATESIVADGQAQALLEGTASDVVVE